MAEPTKEEKKQKAREKAFLKEIQTPLDVPTVDKSFMHTMSVMDDYIAINFENEKISVDYDKKTVTRENGEVIKISIENEKNLIGEKKVQEEEKRLHSELKEVHQLKTQEVKDDIADTDLYLEKNEEYNAKETLAKEAVASGDYSVFEADALVIVELKGIDFTAEQYARMIIAKADGDGVSDGMKEKRDKALLKMGTFRTYVSALITAGQFERARNSINAVKNIEAKTIIEANTTGLLGLLGIGGA